ncbi:transcriptional regulator [Streptococcus pneumoniae]|nr:transcriptional regulator [Streptococcus pneumoniae]
MIEKMELGEFYKELRLARKLKQSDSFSAIQVRTRAVYAVCG